MDCLSLVPKFAVIDLLEAGFLPSDWTDQVERCVARRGNNAFLRGGESTSLESEGTNIPYVLVTGDAITDELPWLDDLYRQQLLSHASEISGVPMMPSDSLLNGININVLDGRGSRYEWHTDSNPLTCVLFVTEHAPPGGGALVFRIGEQECRFWPRPGLAALFDARNAPHSVEPLQGDGRRISMPMNYYIANESPDRPAYLDDYLYGSN